MKTKIKQSLRVFKSSALVALLLFACADLSFRCVLQAGKFDRFEAANHRWAWWQAKGYKELPYTPDVVLMGSSLLTRVVNEGEATYLRQPVNATRHNRSKHLEVAIQQQTGVPLKTYAFNLAGMHASDAAVVANGLLRDKTPSTIIYTIAPRDFLDNLLEAPYTTEAFELMSRTSKLGELSAHARLSTADKINFFFVDNYLSILALAQCKYELSTLCERNWRSILVPALDNKLAKGKKVISPLAIGIKTSAFDYPDSLTVAPEDPHHIEKYDNLQCYRFCYQPFRPKLYNAQLYYLDYLLKFAREKNIDIILVNMPLRKDNLTAMMPNFWDMYQQDIKAHAAKYGAKYVDLFDANQFSDADFVDTVHLTGHGAIKLVDNMAKAVAPNVVSSILAHRSGRNKQIAEHGSFH